MLAFLALILISAAFYYQHKSTTNTSNTFHSSVHSLSLSVSYPFSANENNGSIDISLKPNYVGRQLSGMHIQTKPFDTEFNVAMDSYKLRYDQNTNEWTRKTADDGKNTPSFTPSCEEMKLLGTQQIPAYNVSYKYKKEYVIVLKQGLLYISESPVEEPIPPEASKTFDAMANSITFDHPESVIKARCN